MTGFRYAAIVALVALAGCGSRGGGQAGASSSPNAHDAAVKFAECMRQHGVNMADPQPGQPGLRITGKNLSDTQLNAAMQACRKYNPKGNIDPNDPKVRDHALKMAQCLRQHGVNVPDPQPGQGLKIQVRKGDPNLQRAMQTCQKQVPPPGGATPRTNG